MEDSRERIHENDKYSRYAGYETPDGNYLIYDREKKKAWVKADVMIPIEDML